MTKLSALTTDAAPTGDDFTYTVDNTGTISKRATWAVLFASAPFLTGVRALFDTDTTLAGNSDLVAPSQKAIKTYVDGLSFGIPTVTTNDTGLWPVTTVGNQTVINLSNALTTISADYSDAAFTLHNAAFATAFARFAVANSTPATSRTYTLPDVSGEVVIDNYAQTLTNKKLTGPILSATTVGSVGGVTIRDILQTHADETNNYGARTNPNKAEVFGYFGSNARLGFLSHGGGAGTPAQSTAAQNIGEITVRGYTTTGWDALATAILRFQQTELHTASAGGTRIDFVVMPTTTVTQTRALTITADPVPGIIVRGAIAASAGAGMAAAPANAALYALTGGIWSADPTYGVGYSTGAGGAVTQATSKSTGVTLDKITGAITMNAATLNAATSVGFTLTNAAIAATDTVVVSIKSGATANSYTVDVDAVAAGSCHIHLRNISGGNLSEAVVLNFAVVKAVAA